MRLPKKQRSNAVMKRLLSNLGPLAVIPDELADVLRAGLIERNGCALLRAFENSAGEFDPVSHFDRTGYECLVNHVHFDADGTSNSPLARALAYAERLQQVLCSAEAGPYRMIVGASSDAGSCTVRFHRLRAGENWIDDDLDSYGEGITVIDC